MSRWKSLSRTVALTGCVAGLAVPVTTAAASTITVDDDRAQCPNAGYTAIQAAVDAAAPYDTIAICDGTYRESSTPSDPATGVTGAANGLTIRKNLTLRGAGPSKVLIEPAATSGTLAGSAPALLDGGGNVVTVSRQSLGSTAESELSVTISGVTIASPDVDVEAGVNFFNSSGHVVNSVIGPLHNATSGAPLGWGVVLSNSYLGVDSPGAPARRLQIDGSRIAGYGAGGVRVDGATHGAPTTRSGISETGEIRSTVIDGGGDGTAGRTGVEFHSGADGVVSGSRIFGNLSSGAPRTSVGLLLTDAGTVGATGNAFAGNGYGVFNADAGDSAVRDGAPVAAPGNFWGAGGPLVGTPSAGGREGVSGLDSGSAASVTTAPHATVEPAGIPETGPLPTADGAPTASLTSPLSGTPLTAGGAAHVLASAGDDFGVTSVSAYLGSRLLGTDGTAPYDVAYTVPADLAGTTQSITVVATDSSGQTASDGVTVTIPSTDVPVTPPAIGRIGGLSGVVSASHGFSLTIPTVGAASVTVMLGATTICRDTAAPFTCAYKPSGQDVGAQTLTIVATSTRGATATSTAAIRIGRFTGAKLIVTGRRATGGVRVTGKLTPPARVTRAQACRGAKVVLESGGDRRTVSLSATCTLSATVPGRGTKVRASYRGSSAVASIGTVSAKVG
ncbi:MAG TPA: Ig-like domain-containing protein [Baekduia sp.]|uniref:Ig-like domain-containing protein n=1 Tax=Baekduia sp. TaxID=2600305 RepID=UPI002CFDCB1A|nr:Ig-like domain-containing protein [Baekduia sp.]HMJ36719.1 Ig-like domain-containing protein [Baekduia sp.]